MFILLGFFVCFCQLDEPKAPDYQGKPVCGIMSIIAAAKSLDKEITAERFLDSSYISDPQGSTIGDLESIASQTDLHLHTVVYPDISLFENATSPILINLAVRSDAKCLGHWVTFLGKAGNKWKVFDSARSPSVQLVRPADLLLRSRGVAVVVSDKNKEARTLAVTLHSHLHKICLVLFICAAFLSSTLIARADGPLVSQLIVLSVVCALTIVGCFLIQPHNVIRQKSSSLWMTSTPAEDAHLPRVEIGAAFEKPTPKHRLFVDARLSSINPSGITPSISVGVDLPIEEVRNRTGKLDLATEMIVFCQSDKCDWADIVGERLIKLGFKNVKVLDGGVNRHLELSDIHGK